MHRSISPIAIAFAIVSFPTQAFSAGSDYAEAMRVRSLVELNKSDELPETDERLELPVTRGYNQRSTQLCWAYALLNALETNFLAKFGGEGVELSRRTMQYLTMEDRYLLKIRGIEDYITERGVAVDALRLLNSFGLVAFADFTDIADPYGDYDIARAVARAPTEAEKIAALNVGLERVYGVPPAETHLGDAPMSRRDLRNAVAGTDEWESYAIARDGREGYRTHPDPDHRPGMQSWFMPEDRFAPRIKEALANGYAVEITIGGHCVLIYGADYDSNGRPVRYLIKDSYPDYFYEASPSRIMSNLVEMTTVKLAE